MDEQSKKEMFSFFFGFHILFSVLVLLSKHSLGSVLLKHLNTFDGALISLDVD